MLLRRPQPTADAGGARLFLISPRPQRRWTVVGGGKVERDEGIHSLSHRHSPSIPPYSTLEAR